MHETQVNDHHMFRLAASPDKCVAENEITITLVSLVGACSLSAWRSGRSAAPATVLEAAAVQTTPFLPRPTCRSFRRAYGRVRGQSRGWYEEVNLICNCGSVDDDHRPDCPLSEDEPE